MWEEASVPGLRTLTYDLSYRRRLYTVRATYHQPTGDFTVSYAGPVLVSHSFVDEGRTLAVFPSLEAALAEVERHIHRGEDPSGGTTSSPLWGRGSDC